MTHDGASDSAEVADTNDSGSAPRRPYHPPRLTVYGDARELTKTVGSKNTKDGSGSRKTGF
jgi:hypothetical protein